MKTAFITGGERGLGLGFAEELKSRGYDVIIGSYSKSEVEGFKTINIDVSSDSSIENAFNEVAKLTDHIDLLINNAGLNYDSPGFNPESTTRLDKLDRKDFDMMFQVNAFGPAFVAKIFMPLLKNSKVVNISSYRASFSDRDKVGNYNNYAYSASKAALNMLTRDLAYDLKSQSTTVYAINPGSVNSAMHANGEMHPRTAAKIIINTVEKLTLNDTGKFLNNSGEDFPR